MERLLAFILVALLSLTLPAPSIAISKEGNVITLTPEEDALCVAAGGCTVIPNQRFREELAKALQEAYSRGFQAGRADAHTECRS